MAGRPPKYNDPELLQIEIDKYIDECIQRKIKMTFSGLAYALGFCERQSLNDYAKKDDPISIPIKRAMLRIEQGYEENLFSSSPTGAIFAMKNRGWKDSKQIETNIKKSYDDLSDDELNERIAELEQNTED